MRSEKIEQLKQLCMEFQTVHTTMLPDQTPHFLSITTEKRVFQNGTEIIRERLLKQGRNGDAVVIIPLFTEGNILLVVEPRQSKQTVGVSFPAGYIEPNEIPEAAARRELLEETGYTCDTLELLEDYNQDQGISGAHIYMFLAHNIKKVQEQQLDPSEFVHYLDCTIEEAHEFRKLRYIDDVNTTFGLQLLKKYR